MIIFQNLNTTLIVIVYYIVMNKIEKGQNTAFLLALTVVFVAAGFLTASVVAKNALLDISKQGSQQMADMKIPSDAVTIINDSQEGVLQNYSIMIFSSGVVFGVSVVASLFLYSKTNLKKIKFETVALMLISLGIGVLAGTSTANRVMDQANLTQTISEKLINHYSIIPISKATITALVNQMLQEYLTPLQQIFGDIMKDVRAAGGIILACGQLAALSAVIRREDLKQIPEDHDHVDVHFERHDQGKLVGGN